MANNLSVPGSASCEFFLVIAVRIKRLIVNWFGDVDLSFGAEEFQWACHNRMRKRSRRRSCFGRGKHTGSKTLRRIPFLPFSRHHHSNRLLKLRRESSCECNRRRLICCLGERRDRAKTLNAVETSIYGGIEAFGGNLETASRAWLITNDEQGQTIKKNKQIDFFM